MHAGQPFLSAGSMLAPRHLHSDPSAHPPLHLTLTGVVQRQFGMHTLICSPITRPYVETLTLSVRVGWTKLLMSFAMLSASSLRAIKAPAHGYKLLGLRGLRARLRGPSRPLARTWSTQATRADFPSARPCYAS